jgi:hypothetical protein
VMATLWACRNSGVARSAVSRKRPRRVMFILNFPPKNVAAAARNARRSGEMRTEEGGYSYWGPDFGRVGGAW